MDFFAYNLLSSSLAAFAWVLFWQTSVLILAVWLLDLLLARRVRAAIRYGLWLLVLLKFFIPPSLAFPSGLAWWFRPAARSHNEEIVSRPVQITYAQNTIRAPVPLTPRLAQPAPVSVASLGVASSLLVSIGLIVWMLQRQRQVNSILRRATAAPAHLEEILAEAKNTLRVNRRVGLRLTNESISPALCGMLRPVILVPDILATALRPHQLRSVLLHELVHFKRGDVWVSCLQSLIQTVCWWHPLLWFANARIRRLREEAVDDAVMFALSSESVTYAPTLVEVARLALRKPVATLGFVGILESPGTLKHRVQRLVNASFPRRAGLGGLSCAAIIAFGAVALPMGPPTSTPHESRLRMNGATTNSPDVSALGFDWYLGNYLMSRSAQSGVHDHVQRTSLPESQGAIASSTIYNRMIKVDPKLLKKFLASCEKYPEDEDAVVIAQKLSDCTRAFFESCGLDLKPPKALFVNHGDGSILMRATLAELDFIEFSLSQLEQASIQISVKVTAAQLNASQAATFWADGMPRNATNRVIYLERDAASRQLDRLIELAGPDQIHQANVITLSGRQAQIQVADIITVVTNISKDNPEAFRTAEVPVGLVIDLVPWAKPNSQTLQLQITASFTEFLGYDDPGQFVPFVPIYDSGSSGPVKPITAELPLPHFRLREIRPSGVLVPDGQSVLLGGAAEFETYQIPKLGELPKPGRLFRRPTQEKELIVIVTATAVDPAGNPMHEQ